MSAVAVLVLAVASSASGVPASVASAATPTTTARIAVEKARAVAEANKAEAVFAFGDFFETVADAFSFMSDARNPAVVASACQEFLAAYGAFAGTLKGVGNRAARDVGRQLLNASAATLATCRTSSATVDDATAEAINLDFLRYRELAFDFADLAPSAS